jgi:hypothetical protein
MLRRRGVLAFLLAMYGKPLYSEDQKSGKVPPVVKDSSKLPTTFRWDKAQTFSAEPVSWGVTFESNIKSCRFSADGRTVELSIKEIMDILEGKTP